MKHTIVAFTRLEMEASLPPFFFFCLFFTYPLQTDLTPQPDDVSNKTWNRSAGRLHGFAARLQQVAASVIGINSTSTGAPPQRERSQSGDSPRSSCV